MKITCEYCSKDFDRSPSQISKHNFCSRECYIKAKKENKTLHPNYSGGSSVICTHCGKFTYKNPSQLVNHSNYFCSVKCFGCCNAKS